MSAVTPTAPVAAPVAPKPSLFRRFLAQVDKTAESVLRDPLVQKEGKALFGAAVVRIAIALGAGTGTIIAVQAGLHAAGF